MVLLRDVPLEESIDDHAFDPTSIDVEEVRRLFEFLEFNTLFDRLAAALDTELGPSASEAAVLEAEVCQEIGRAAARARVGEYGSISGVAVSLDKKTHESANAQLHNTSK